ncbi:hypothetical protein L0636_06705 [Halomonas janggokensis]|uniref:Uncharacterized protein n=1 Tax=Vreelandella janggokensis TaxID=370767 RepID=A0ABT4IVB7_9GAMM|nr:MULTISPECIES: hypothetical protein [Halomonas]MCZ0927609.1 hypothetical protein [Halomonas janggokensis]MCZ0930117.1 hypothetical protein [Halomonas janggokensis]QPL46218.1 hypothetical protein IT895_19100 [Halomonas sp. A40-4]
MKVSSVSSIQSELLGPQRVLTVITLVSSMIVLGMTKSQADDSHALSSNGFAAMQRMNIEEMDRARAREGEAIVNFNTVKSIQNMQASVTDTSFNIGGNMVSGNISFASDALGNYSGTGIFSAVTGNGNSINNAVGISVFIAN